MNQSSSQPMTFCSPPTTGIRAVILDRDGTLIRHVPYLSDPQQVVLLPGVQEGLARLSAASILLFLHSNQSGVGRGLFSLDDVTACNQAMLRQLNLADNLFQRVCIAPEAPSQPALYRKPSARFAAEVMRDYGLQPLQICYVGDRGTDLATAAAAGTCGIGVATGLDDLETELRELQLESRFAVVRSFLDVVDRILTGNVTCCEDE